MVLKPPSERPFLSWLYPGTLASRVGSIASTRTFSAFRHRNYRLFFLGQTISLSGTWLQWVAQGWLIYELTKSPLALGIVGFATRMPVLGFALLAGVIADRMDKRKILVLTQSVAMLQALTLALLTITGIVRLWHVAALGALLGLTQSFDAPTRQSFVKDMVGREDLMNAIALNSTMFNTARLVGPALAGILIKLVGIGMCFLINGLTYLAVITAYLAMRFNGQSSERQVATRHWDDLKEGLKYVRSNRIVATAICLIGVASLFTFSYGTLLPVFAGKVLSGGSGLFAALMAAAGAGALCSSLLVASLGNYQRKGLLATLGSFGFPLSILAVSFARTARPAIALCFLLGITMIILTASMNTLVQSIIPDRLRGRVMSLYVLVFLGGMPFGNLAMGWIADNIGVVATLRIGAIVSLCLVSLLLSRTREFVAVRA